MKHQDFQLKYAFDYLKEKRPIASPRNQFIRQLIEIEEDIFDGVSTLEKDDFPVYEAPKVKKSFVVLDIKPISDSVSMKELEKAVRGIKKEGLVWCKCKYSTFL